MTNLGIKKNCKLSIKGTYGKRILRKNKGRGKRMTMTETIRLIKGRNV